MKGERQRPFLFFVFTLIGKKLKEVFGARPLVNKDNSIETSYLQTFAIN